MTPKSLHYGGVGKGRFVYNAAVKRGQKRKQVAFILILAINVTMDVFSLVMQFSGL